MSLSLVEFEPPGTFEPVTDYHAGGPHGLAPGEWTDDTSRALALAESFAQVGWDIAAQAQRYLRWWRIGAYSVNGSCFDVGFRRRSPPEIIGGGDIVESLEAALWAFHQADGSGEAVLRAVNLGDDADTTGAVCGQLAGPCRGESRGPGCKT